MMQKYVCWTTCVLLWRPTDVEKQSNCYLSLLFAAVACLLFFQIVQDMWSESPNDRPSARQIVARMQKLLDKLDATGDW